MAKVKNLILIFSLLVSWQSGYGATAAPTPDTQNFPEHEKTERTITVTSETVFNADQSMVWHTLTDFQNYPSIFKRIESTEVLRHEGNFVYVESNLRPHFFIKHATQHIVNDLSSGPKVLRWHMLDGNFSHVDGRWEIQPRSPHSCVVKYTLAAEPGPVIPAPIISLIVHHVQKEIVEQLKHYVESEFKRKLEAMNQR